jgi:hypothetical protein
LRVVPGERLKAERETGLAQPSGQLTKKQIRALVSNLKDIAAVLATADPNLKAEAYAELGISSAPASVWSRKVHRMSGWSGDALYRKYHVHTADSAQAAAPKSAKYDECSFT